MYDLGCMLVESRPFAVLDGLLGLYGLKYDSATACGLPLYLCSYKLVGSAIIAERKNHTLTELVNAMLETTDLFKEWWGEAILTACHVLNRVPTKNKEITQFEKWKKKRLNLLYLRTWGCLAKVNVPINKKRKLRPKTVDCVFLGYAIHNVGYRFLIINSSVPEMAVDTIIESRDATFFK